MAVAKKFYQKLIKLMVFRHTKYAYLTYENSHPTYEKYLSDLKIEWPSDSYNYLFLPYCAICMTKAAE